MCSFPGRVDDIINVKLVTGYLHAEMEEAVSGHKDVAECCVVGIDDDLKVKFLSDWQF